MRKQVILLSCAALLVLVAGSNAQEDKQPFLGVLLDESALPELLTKHLGLESGQGLRVVNIGVDSTAARLGLDRDDLLVAFQGQKITDPDEFITAMKKAGVGAKVSLEVIHLGQRRTVQFELEPAGKMEWKYPTESSGPEPVTSWRPGKLWKIGPDGQRFEIPFDKLPNIDFDIGRILKATYTYKHIVDGEECIITIEGDPAESDTRVAVRAGSAEHSATVGAIDALPEKYRDSVRQALEDAKKRFHFRDFKLPELPSTEIYQKLFQDLPRPDVQRLYEEKDRTIEKLQEQMEKMQQRMQQLEDRLLNRKSNPEPRPDKTEQPAATQTEDKLSV